MSSHTTSRRGLISALTARSPNLKMLFTMSCSASSNIPASVPCSIMTLISSSVTGGSSDGRNRRTPMRRRVDPLINATIGEQSLDTKSRLCSPIVALISGSTRLLMGVLRLRPSEEPPVTEEEIKVMMEQGTEAGIFEEAEHDIVKSIFKLGDRAVSALMRPRRDVVWLDIEDSFPENQRKLAGSLYSRFPVAHGSLDNVIGIIQAKDLLTRCLAGAKID